MSPRTPVTVRTTAELKHARWMLLVLAAAFPGWWFVLGLFVPGAIDPLPARLIVSALVLGTLAMSYRQESVGRSLGVWLAVDAGAASVVAVWLAVANETSDAYAAHLLATLGSAALFVRGRYDLACFWAAVITAFLVALASLAEIPAHTGLLVAMTAPLMLLHVTVASRDELLQEQIVERTTLLREVFENATDALFLLDPSNHQILLANHRATQIFLAPELDALLDRDARQLPARPLTEDELAAIWAAAERGDELRLEVPFRRFAGSPFWGDAAWRAIIIGPRTYLLLRITPIDERIQVQQALEAARDAAEAATVAKSNFLANMSHEIRTPLNGVLGLAQLLERSELDRDQQAYVATMLASGRTLLSLIDELLDFSRIEAGELVIVEDPFDLRQAMDDLRLLFRAQSEAKALPVRFELTPELPARVMADGKRLKQVLVNLLGNAVKFTRDGEVVFRADRIDRGERTWIRFEVSDTGIGIDEKDFPRLFQPFSQVDPGIARRFGGTGLGLAISKSISDRMGGRLLASSRVGVGSTFTFEVPVTVLAPSAVPAPDDVVGEVPPAGRPRVLVTEDNEVNRMVIVEILRRLGCEVDVAPDGESALERIARHDVDVVLMDVMMPGIDGLETTRRLRRLGLARRPWVVALTAGVMPGDRERCLAAGMDDFVAKPVQIDEVRLALRRAEASDRSWRASS